MLTRSWWITQMIQRIWKTYCVFWEQMEWRKGRAKNYCTQHFYLVLREEQDKVSTVESGQCLWLAMSWVLRFALLMRQFRVISTEMHLQKFADSNEISEFDREFPIRVFATVRVKKMSEFLTSSRKKKGKEQNSFIERKTGDCFQRKSIKFAQIEEFAVSGHVTHWTLWDYGERSEGRKEISSRASILFSIESERTDWREKSNSLKVSPVTGDEYICCLWMTRWQRSLCNCRLHPVCRDWKSGNRSICAIYCLIDLLMVRSNLSAGMIKIHYVFCFIFEVFSFVVFGLSTGHQWNHPDILWTTRSSRSSINSELFPTSQDSILRRTYPI